MNSGERQPGIRIDRRTALLAGIAAVAGFTTHVPPSAHAQGVPQEARYPGIRPPLIGMTPDGHPIYEQVSNAALIAQRDAQLRQSPFFDPNFGGAMVRPDCDYTFWQTTARVMSPAMEREFREKNAKIALARQAVGKNAEIPGLLPQERVNYWKDALLPLTTTPTYIRLELWTKDAAFNNRSTDRPAFYLADFRAHLKGKLALPTISNPDQVVFMIRWATGEVVLLGNIATLQDLLKYGGADILSVIDMTDPKAAAQAAALAPNPLSDAWRATMGNPYLQGEPVCVSSPK